MLSGRILVHGVHQLDGMLVTIAGVGLGSLGLRDAQSIARFEELQWQLGIQNHGIEVVARGDVGASLHEFVLGAYFLSRSLGVFTDDVFEHDHIARLPDCVVWLCSNDQSERLKVGGDVKLAAAITAHQYLAQIHRPPLGRNRPKNIRKVLVTEGLRTLQVAKLRPDLKRSALTFNFGFTVR